MTAHVSQYDLFVSFCRQSERDFFDPDLGNHAIDAKTEILHDAVSGARHHRHNSKSRDAAPSCPEAMRNMVDESPEDITCACIRQDVQTGAEKIKLQKL